MEAIRLNVKPVASPRAARESPRILENTQVTELSGGWKVGRCWSVLSLLALISRRVRGLSGSYKKGVEEDRDKRGKSILTCRSEVPLFPSLGQSNRRKRQTTRGFQSAREGRDHTGSGRRHSCWSSLLALGVRLRIWLLSCSINSGFCCCICCANC